MSIFMPERMAPSIYMKMKVRTIITRKELIRRSILIIADATNTLTIGSREGSYPGCYQRTFNIIYVSPNAPAGWDNKGKPAKVIEYKGEQISVKL